MLTLRDLVRHNPQPFIFRDFAMFGSQRIEIISVQGMTGWRFATSEERRRFTGKLPEQDATPKE